MLPKVLAYNPLVNIVVHDDRGTTAPSSPINNSSQKPSMTALEPPSQYRNRTTEMSNLGVATKFKSARMAPLASTFETLNMIKMILTETRSYKKATHCEPKINPTELCTIDRRPK